MTNLVSACSIHLLLLSAQRPFSSFSGRRNSSPSIPTIWLVGVGWECYPSHKEVNNTGKTNQKFTWDLSNWSLWGTALFPHKSWSFKDKILRHLIDMAPASWGKLVSMSEKKREKLGWNMGRQRQRETWGLHFSGWRPLDPLLFPIARVWFPEAKCFSKV